MTDKVLFVDDDDVVLESYRRMFGTAVNLDTAASGEEGMALISDRGPYALVITDMRMPGMNGAQFLAQVRQKSPDSVRVLLTACTDLQAAVDAVNDGNIFRFLPKPCAKEILSSAIDDGLALHRLINTEKNLLEKTLMGSIKVLTDVLSAASPEAFGRSMSITDIVRHMVSRLRLPSPWRFEAAAMLSQLGCIMLDPKVMQAAFVGDDLSDEQQAGFAAHPQAARSLLMNIPRLEPIAWMIGQQLSKGIDASGALLFWPETDIIVKGAKILKLAVAFESLRMKGLEDDEAIAGLRIHDGEFDSELVEALEGIQHEAATMQLRKVPTSRLKVGMILQQEVRTQTGALMVPKGQEITPALLMRFETFSRSRTVDDAVLVMVPARFQIGARNFDSETRGSLNEKPLQRVSRTGAGIRAGSSALPRSASQLA